MEMSISPQQFHKALLSGAVGIINKREELNRINGFPVPDKDTGNNLGFMMQHIRKQLLPASNFKNLLNKLSELSLIASEEVAVPFFPNILRDLNVLTRIWRRKSRKLYP